MTGQIGAALSPVLVVPIQRHFGWRVSFWVFGVLGVIWAVTWYRWFRDWPAQKAGVSAAELEEIGPPPAPIMAACHGRARCARPGCGN